MQNTNAPPNDPLSDPPSEDKLGCLSMLLGAFVALTAIVVVLGPPILVLAGLFMGAFAEPSVNSHSFWDNAPATSLFTKWCYAIAIVIAWLVLRRSKATASFVALLTAPLVAWVFIPTALTAWHNATTTTRAAYVVKAEIERGESMRTRISYVKEHRLRLSEWGGDVWFDANDRFSLSRVTHPFETPAGRLIDHGAVVCVDESRSASGSIRLENLRACDSVPHGLTRTPVSMVMHIDFVSSKSPQPIVNNESGIAVPEATAQWFEAVSKNPPSTNLQWKLFNNGVEFTGGDDNDPNSQTGSRVDWPFLKQDSAWEILSVSKRGGTVLAYRRGMPRLFSLDTNSGKWSELPVVLHLPYHLRPETVIEHAQLSDDGQSISVCYVGMCILLRSPTAASLFKP